MIDFSLPGIKIDDIVLKSAWLAISNPTSKSIHLEPRQAAALVNERQMLWETIDRLSELLAEREPAHPFEDAPWETEQ